jgi:hypothetical protein
VFFNNRALESGGGSGADVAGVHMQPFEQRLARLRQLLDRVHNLNLVLNAQMCDQRLIGELVNAGLVATQIDRNAVGLFVAQGAEHPVARGHGFFLLEAVSHCPFTPCPSLQRGSPFTASETPVPISPEGRFPS